MCDFASIATISSMGKFGLEPLGSCASDWGWIGNYRGLPELIGWSRLLPDCLWPSVCSICAEDNLDGEGCVGCEDLKQSVPMHARKRLSLQQPCNRAYPLLWVCFEYDPFLFVGVKNMKSSQILENSSLGCFSYTDY